jgi:hypothetical protein
MLYGHIERLEHRVDHMRRLRELQDETGGFNVFIPLAFQPFDNDMGITRYTVGMDDLRTIAIARLFLDNFRHIKAYWIMLGQDIAQIALNFGANDLDGTVTEEKISRMAGGRAGMAMDKKQIHSLIRKANKVPVERDTLYHPVWRDPSENQLFNDTEKHATASMILYRVEQGEQLKFEQAQLLADYGQLFQLGHCAKIVRDRIGADAYAVAPTLPRPTCSDLTDVSAYLKTHAEILQSNPDQILEIDLGCLEWKADQVSFQNLLNFVHTARRKFPRLQFKLAGLKSLWGTLRAAGLDLKSGIEAVSSAGIAQIGSSEHESETDLTTDEIVNFHRVCHQFDIATTAKVELSADYSGIKHPFWQPYLRRLELLIALQKETRGLRGISVEVARDSRVTPVEYLRAVALTRIMAHNVPVVLCPINCIPTIRPRAQHYANANHDPVMKIAPLTSCFGASDFGSVSLADGYAQILIQELEVSGIKPVTDTLQACSQSV